MNYPKCITPRKSSDEHELAWVKQDNGKMESEFCKNCGEFTGRERKVVNP